MLGCSSGPPSCGRNLPCAGCAQVDCILELILATVIVGVLGNAFGATTEPNACCPNKFSFWQLTAPLTPGQNTGTRNELQISAFSDWLTWQLGNKNRGRARDKSSLQLACSGLADSDQFEIKPRAPIATAQITLAFPASLKVAAQVLIVEQTGLTRGDMR